MILKQRFTRLMAGILASLGVGVSFSVYGQNTTNSPQIAIIPQPQHLTQLPGGKFNLNATTKIYVDPKSNELKNIALLLAQDINRVTGRSLAIVAKQPKAKASNIIYLTLKQPIDSLGAEGYVLKVQPARITLSAQQPQGIFIGTETIRQLLPAQPTATASVLIPAVEIVDKPRYQWRGMHLDVARHFFPVSFIKKYIDYLAMHKMNTFHWHLTEDQGWRIEIKKYPKLTTEGAWRNKTLIGHYSDQPHQFDNTRYGGFYTQEEIKEVIKYAQERYITVVPEIELPGHSLAALTAYPEISCTGGPFQVTGLWGVFDDIYCAGNEQTFTFLEDVLTEVAALFSSPIIHIGGDEAPKTRWKQCPKCQARMKTENLKDEHELQSYFIQRIEKFLATKNKKITGWDEILEGGLAPNAAVMSWRGTEGGIAAAKQKHEVVMTPGSHVYFDHYQGDPSLEPLAFGGYTTLQKVYSFEPTPTELTAAERKYILGAQANVWTEYIPTTQQVEYMIMPRMAALSEVLWTNPARKNWEDFKGRMQQQYQRYEALGINYAKSAYQVRQQISIDTVQKTAEITFATDASGPQIYYTLDGTEPSAAALVYTKPFTLNKTSTIKAASVADKQLMSKATTKKIIFHNAYGHSVNLLTPAHQNYKGAGPVTLVNGLAGSTNHADGQWLGFLEQDFVAVIDLKQSMPLKQISSSYLQSLGAGIFLPSEVEYAVSEDGKKFKTLKSINNSIAATQAGKFTKTMVAEFPGTRARYVKVIAKNIKKSPANESGKQQKAWLFVDEIIVE